jgi:DNA-binding CsgD family transcriptional regulator
VFIAYVVLLIIQSSWLGISDDEAYYWALAQNPSWGFAYHPPGVVWFIYFFQKLLSPLFGEKALFVVRASSIVSSVLIAYNQMSASEIHQYVHKIYLLQEYVFSTEMVVSYIDMLPYNNKFKTYIVTLIPLYYEGQEIIALQTFSNETRVFHFQDYLAYNSKSIDSMDEMCIDEKEFSERELEIMFLLSHGLTQEQCAQIQGISRSTVATMIKNLCIKFKVAGSNSRALQQIAFQNGHHRIIPKSLWKPCVIIADSKAASYINRELAKK